jgi:hypothetical protein
MGAFLFLISGCRTQPPSQSMERVATPEQPPQDSLPGYWVLEHEPVTRGPGIQLELELDSVVRSVVYGRLAHYFAGDIGVDPTSFPRLTGTLTDADYLTIRIEHAEVEAAGFELAGQVAGDTIPLDLWVIGPDTIGRTGAGWRLVRRVESR